MSKVLLNDNILNNNSTNYNTTGWTDDGWATDDQPFINPENPGENNPIYEDDEVLIPPDPTIPITPLPRAGVPNNNNNNYLYGLGLLALYMVI